MAIVIGRNDRCVRRNEMIWPIVEAERATFCKAPDTINVLMHIVDLGICFMNRDGCPWCEL